MIDLVKRDVTERGDIVTDDGADVWIRILKQHQIKLYDKNGTYLSNLEHILAKASWDWNRIGGCGSGEFTFKESWDGAIAGSFTEDAEIRVVIKDDAGDDVDWFSGTVNRVTPTADGTREAIKVLTLGFVDKLKKYIVKDKTYLNKEISVTAKDVIDNYVAPNSGVTSGTADYDDTGFTADSLAFNESAHDVIVKLAATAGKIEWGVRADKSFFFKKEDQTTKHFFFISENFASYKPTNDYDPIITKIYLQGGGDFNANFTVSNRTILSEVIVQNASITTQSVAQQFARVFLKKNGKPKRSFVGFVPNTEDRKEATVPLGRAAVNLKLGINLKYDVAGQKYDSGLKYDGGTETFQMERIRYTLEDDKMNTTLYFGSIPPGLSDELARLESQLNNERNT